MGEVIDFEARAARQERRLREHGIEQPSVYLGGDPFLDVLLEQAETARAKTIRLTDIDKDAVRHAVEVQGERFVTHDISKSRIMTEAHGSRADAPAYHKVVGRWMSIHRYQLGLRLLTYRTPGGARWEKVQGTR